MVPGQPQGHGWPFPRPVRGGVDDGDPDFHSEGVSRPTDTDCYGTAAPNPIVWSADFGKGTVTVWLHVPLTGSKSVCQKSLP